MSRQETQLPGSSQNRHSCWHKEAGDRMGPQHKRSCVEAQTGQAWNFWSLDPSPANAL
jgi:hypothetical protein